jgi:CheY-like chemotaxis protein
MPVMMHYLKCKKPELYKISHNPFPDNTLYLHRKCFILKQRKLTIQVPGVKPCILIADDDADDQYMISQAFITLKFEIDVKSVNDGMELFDYLHTRNKFEQQETPPPKVILLDLNMPRKDGRECLRELKTDAKFHKIPVVVYSTSNSPDDIAYCYENGASSYIVKPYSFKELLEVMEVFRNYWFGVVQTPGSV